VLLAVVLVGAGLGTAWGAPQLHSVSVISPDSGVVRGIDSAFVAQIKVINIGSSDSLQVVAWLVTSTDSTVVGDSTAVTADTAGVAYNFQTGIKAAAGGNLVAAFTTGGTNVHAILQRRGRGFKKFGGDSTLVATDSVKWVASSDTTIFTWYGRVRDEMGVGTGVRVAAYTSLSGSTSSVMISPTSRQFSIDAERPLTADAFVTATFGGSAASVANFVRGTTNVLGINDTIKADIKLGSQANAVVLGDSLRVISDFFGVTTWLSKTARTADTLQVRIPITAGLYGNLVGSQGSAATDTFQVFVVDAAGNYSRASGTNDATPQGVTAGVTFLVDALAPAINGGVVAGDTIYTANNDSVSNGVIISKALGNTTISTYDRQPFIYNLGEALDSLLVTFSKTGKTVKVKIDSTLLSITNIGLAKSTDYGLDIKAVGNGGGGTDTVKVLTTPITAPAVAKSFLGTTYASGDTPLVSGTYTITVQGTDVAGNVGSAYTISNVLVDVDEIAFSRLFPAKGAAPDTIEEATSQVIFQLSEPADSVLITYRGIAGTDLNVSRSRKLSGTELTRTTEATYAVDSLKNATTYALSVIGRDLVGNYTVTGPDTFRYDTSFVVPAITRFAVASSQKGYGSPLLAGSTVTLTLTAYNSTDASRVAVTYKEASAILKVAGGEGLTLSGTGVTDLGNGRATLSRDDWNAGTRTVTLKDTVSVDTLVVSIVDSLKAGGPYAGQLDSVIVFNPAAVNKIVVTPPATVNTGVEFTVGVKLADIYGNARVADDRFVTVSANKLGVEVPAGPIWIDNGVGSFVAKANAVMTGLTFRVSDTVEMGNTAGTTIQGVSSAVTVGAAAVAAIDAPDTLIAEDYMGADGAGDQGGFVLLTFPLSSDHATLTGYRIYREVSVNYDLVGGVLTATPATALMPWGRVDAVPGETVGRVIVATLDNVASVWAIAAERGNATSGKEAFDAAAVVATPYELMASTMVASQQAALQPNTPVFATLTPEAFAYIEKGVAPSMKYTDADLSAKVLTANKVRGIDNIAPEAVTYLRAMDTPADAGSSVTVVWAKSVSDQMLPRFVGSAVSNGSVSDAVAGVTGYNVYRKVGTGEYTLVGTAGAGETSFADLTAFNGVRYTYKIQPYDQDNESASALERTAMAIRNSAVDLQGKPVYGLFGMDNRVGFDDFFVFADNFGLTAGDETFEAAFDLAQNARVDFEDFFVFADNFGRSIEAAGKTIPTMAGLNTDALLSLDAGSQLPRVGEEVSVNVNLADFVELKGYGFSVNYDATKLEFVKVDAAENLLGEGELAAPRVLSQQDGQVAIAAYGQTATEGNMALNLVFRTKSEIESTLIEVTESEVRDGNYAVNQIALPAPVQIQTRPETYALGNNYPNPFNPATTIKYALPEAGLVKLEVYNVVGQVVRTLVSEQQNAGRYAIQWNASDDSGYSLSSGIYFYRLQAGDNFLEVKKMLLLK
jgi:hypothetical protein